MKKGIYLVLILCLVLSLSACNNSDNNSDFNDVNETNNTINITSEEINNSTNNSNETDSNGLIGTCIDSDDGLKYEDLGYILINGTKEYMDSCISDSYLREYYCNETYPGKVSFGIYSCYGICEEGICTVVETNTTNTTNST